jgi:hypothetical protein
MKLFDYLRMWLQQKEGGITVRIGRIGEINEKEHFATVTTTRITYGTVLLLIQTLPKHVGG